MKKFVQNIVTFSLRNTTCGLFGVMVLLLAGSYALRHTPIEAFPAVTNTRARIITQWSGRSAEEMEKLVTMPIPKGLNTIPKKFSKCCIVLIRLSVVTVQFVYEVTAFSAQ